jgi:ABC-type nitrate/sulfonate/bicarbonate transport system permease component
VIAAASADFNVALMFASIVILSLIGVLSSQLIAGIRRRVAFWEPGQSPRGNTVV